MIDFNAVNRLVTGTLFHQKHQEQSETDCNGRWKFSEPPNASHFTGKLTTRANKIRKLMCVVWHNNGLKNANLNFDNCET